MSRQQLAHDIPELSDLVYSIPRRVDVGEPSRLGVDPTYEGLFVVEKLHFFVGDHPHRVGEVDG